MCGLSPILARLRIPVLKLSSLLHELGVLLFQKLLVPPNTVEDGRVVEPELLPDPDVGHRLAIDDNLVAEPVPQPPTCVADAAPARLPQVLEVVGRVAQVIRDFLKKDFADTRQKGPDPVFDLISQFFVHV